jgi:thiamine biosynthesis lipoprotein
VSRLRAFDATASQGIYRRTIVIMDTAVTFEAVRHPRRAARVDPEAHVDRAIAWFRRVEASCSRFDDASEVRQLAERVGVPVVVSPILFEAVQFALAVAEESGGAFDPTIGADLEARGFNREYRSGAEVHSGVAPDARVSYRDVVLDPGQRAITMRRPLLLDLGGVAKGLAVDLASRELAPLEDFAIDAGGDLFLSGHNASDEPWTIGIRHPREESQLIDALRLTDCAVCTSGDYARRNEGGHHLIDARTRQAASAIASLTVVAPTAMVADALGTAAFALGPDEGLRFLERHGVDGFGVTPALERFATARRRGSAASARQAHSHRVVLSHA